jgi:hypothetical protein
MDGMTSKFNDPASRAAVIDAFKSIIDDAIAAAKAAAGIASPSKRAAEEIGLPLLQGAAMGADRGAPLLWSAMDRAIGGAIERPIGGARIPPGALRDATINLNPTIQMMQAELPTNKGAYRDAARAMAYDLRDEFQRMGLL